MTPVAGFDEVSHLLRRLRVDDAAEPWRAPARTANHAAIVRNHAYLNAANTRMSSDHFLCVVGLKLVQVSAVQQTVQQVTRVVRLAVVLRNDVVEIGSGSCRILSRQNRNYARRFYG